MNIEQLRLFLIDANKHTYSTGDESINKKESDKSTTIVYQKGEWKFHDNFFGGEPYGGRVVVFFQGKPIWIMVYYGSIISSILPEIVYPVLQKALRNMPTNAPFRGPDELKDGEFTYSNKWTGTIEKYFGEEVIMRNNKEIYRAKYIGGLVDTKK